MQERVVSGQVQTYIEHKPVERFVVNMHAFHNAHLLRAYLPRSLVAPLLVYPDRQANHSTISQGLRVIQEAKRIKTRAQKTDGVPISVATIMPGSSKRKRLEKEGCLE